MPGFLSIALAVIVRGSVPFPGEVPYQPEAVAVARQIGLTPMVLTVGGLTAQQVNAALTRLEQAGALRAELTSRRADVDLFMGRVGQLRSQLRNEPGSAQVLEQLRQAKLQLRSAKQQLTSAKAALATVAAAGLGTGTAQQLAVTCSARLRTVPAELHCVERTAQQWHRLEADLVVERRALRSQQTVPAEVALRLANERSRERVVAARQAIAHELPAIQALFGP